MKILITDSALLLSVLLSFLKFFLHNSSLFDLIDDDDDDDDVWSLCALGL